MKTILTYCIIVSAILTSIALSVPIRIILTGNGVSGDVGFAAMILGMVGAGGGISAAAARSECK